MYISVSFNTLFFLPVSNLVIFHLKFVLDLKLIWTHCTVYSVHSGVRTPILTIITTVIITVLWRVEAQVETDAEVLEVEQVDPEPEPCLTAMESR